MINGIQIYFAVVILSLGSAFGLLSVHLFRLHVSILRREVNIFLFMVPILLEGAEGIGGDNTDILLAVHLPRRPIQQKR